MTEQTPQKRSRFFRWLLPIACVAGLSLVAWLMYPIAGPPLRKLFEQPKGTSFGDLLGWPPIFWTARVLILILLLAGGLVFILFMVRFFRPSSIRDMLKAGLPNVSEVGGTAEILGQKFGATAKLTEAVESVKDEDRIRDRQLEAHATQLAELEKSYKTLDRIVEYVLLQIEAENAEESQE